MWGSENIKEPYNSFHQSVKKLNPHARVILWTDETMVQFMATHFPQDLQWYNELPYNVHRWDSFRYFMLHVYGGMYLDIDMEPTQSFQPLFEHDLVLCREHPDDEKRMDVDIIVSNAMILVKPFHDFTRQLIKNLRSSKPTGDDIISETGPFLVTNTWRARGREVVPLSYEAFYPNSLENSWDKTRGTYATHRFGSSWWGQSNEWKSID